jgi:hypothetical protein
MTVVPAWVEQHCVVPDGFRKGQPLELYDFQLEYFAGFYLVRAGTPWVPDNPVLAPAFVYRRGLLVGPQKLGKSPHTASHVCVEGVGPALFAGFAGKDDGYVCADFGCPCEWEYPYEPGEPMGMKWPTPLIQITANSEEQTDNIYDALRPMIELGPLAAMITHTGEEFIRLPGGGRIDTVTSSARSRLGQRVTFVPQDEVGEWTKTNGMRKVADTQYRGLAGMGGRASLTSNAWDPSQKSVAQLEYESPAPDILRQFVQPPRHLSFRSKADRRKIFAIVYPRDTWRSNGGHVDLNSIEAEAAGMIVHDLPQAARFFGNMLVAGGGRAVDPTVWRKLARTDGKPPAGTYIGIGFDGSVSSDSTGLRGCTADGYSFLIKEWSRPVGEAGQGWRVPRLEVDEAVADAFKRWKVGRMFCDPPKWWTEIEVWAAKYRDKDGKPSIVLALDTNQPSRIGPAVDRWLTAIGEGKHTHDGDPVTTDHVLAAHKQRLRARLVVDGEEDPRTLYRLVKGDDAAKIDLAVTDVLAYEAALTMPPPPKKVQAPRRVR